MAELRAWNGLSGDHLEVGDVLRVGPGGDVASSEAPPSSARPTPKRPPRRTVKAPADPTGPIGLTMPRPEPCRTLSLDPGEEGMVASSGLSVGQARAALDGVIQQALGCMPDPDVDAVRPVFELLVGCDGVVDRVDVQEHGGASPRYARCIADVLAYADFPAHELPEGDVVTYPVTVEF